MQKIIIVLLLIGGIFFLLQEKEDKEIRLRVISNSDSEVDQNFKNAIKNEALDFLEKLLADEKDYEKSIKKIKANINLLDAKIKEELDFCGKVEFGKHLFPVKSQNGKIMESKYYDTLLITIEEGKGSNYWTTLYPTLISDTENVKYEWFVKEFWENLWRG